MRRLFALPLLHWRAFAARSGQRPEALRRAALADTARILIAVSALGAPFAVAGLFAGLVMPFCLTVLGLAAGSASLLLHARGQFEDAVRAQVSAMQLAGLVLTIMDPSVADFGLASVLMAPILAALLAQRGLVRGSWYIALGALALATIGSAFGYAPPESAHPMFDAVCAATFVTLAGMVGYAASALNAAFQVHEKAQIDAYRHLIENVQDAVIRFSPDGEVLFSSRSSETLFGCRQFELSGASLGQRIHVMDRPTYLTAFADANQASIARLIEVRVRQDDPRAATGVPRFVWVEVALSPVVPAEPVPGRHEVVALFRDISDRKDHEAQMREARKVAEDASRAKSHFLATIGHELRTPLNAIVGFSEMMQHGIGGTLAPQHREYAGLIHQSGHHLLELVKMLLDMSKIEAGKFELQTETFAPQALIEPCLQMIEPTARLKEIRIIAEVPPDLPNIVADERACRQILINLLSNAVKFSAEGDIVRLVLRRQGQSLGFSVIDNGIGMGSEAVERIGEPFFQANQGLARRYEGTGLGLSIVKGLVELHEGRLSVQSEPGQGTTMSVLLPLNGPATLLGDTEVVTPLRRDVEAAPVEWHERKRKAQ